MNQILILIACYTLGLLLGSREHISGQENLLLNCKQPNTTGYNLDWMKWRDPGKSKLVQEKFNTQNKKK